MTKSKHRAHQLVLRQRLIGRGAEAGEQRADIGQGWRSLAEQVEVASVALETRPVF